MPDETLQAIARYQPAQGVSGRANYVRDVENERQAMGRFGWKANQTSVRQQIAAALSGDIGTTRYLFQMENCLSVQEQCLDMPATSLCGRARRLQGQHLPSRNQPEPFDEHLAVRASTGRSGKQKHQRPAGQTR